MPLILQSKRAARPSSTSTSSSSRVNRGASEGRTISRALQVSSSRGKGHPRGQERPWNPRHPNPQALTSCWAGKGAGPGAGAWVALSKVPGHWSAAVGKIQRPGLLRRVEVSKGGSRMPWWLGI